MEWLAVRLGRLVCLLRAEDPGCELSLSAPTPQGGERLEAGSPNPLGVPIQALGRTAFPARRLSASELWPPGLCAGCAGHQRRARPPGLGVSPLPSPGSALSARLRSGRISPSAPPSKSGFALCRTQPGCREHRDPPGFQDLMKRCRGFGPRHARLCVCLRPPRAASHSSPQLLGTRRLGRSSRARGSPSSARWCPSPSGTRALGSERLGLRKQSCHRARTSRPVAPVRTMKAGWPPRWPVGTGHPLTARLAVSLVQSLLSRHATGTQQALHQRHPEMAHSAHRDPDAGPSRGHSSSAYRQPRGSFWLVAQQGMRVGERLSASDRQGRCTRGPAPMPGAPPLCPRVPGGLAA